MPLKNLRLCLTQGLSLDEVKDVAFSLGYEYSGSEKKDELVRDILLYAVRRGRLQDLTGAVYVVNPTLDLKLATAKDAATDRAIRASGHTLGYPPIVAPTDNGNLTPAKDPDPRLKIVDPVAVLVRVLKSIPEWSDINERETFLTLSRLSEVAANLSLDGGKKGAADRVVAYCMTYNLLGRLTRGLLEYSTLTEAQTIQLQSLIDDLLV